MLAPIFAAVDLKENRLNFIEKTVLSTFMPKWTASEVLEIFTNRFDPDFCMNPLYDGKSLETGALAYNQSTPLLQEVLHNRPTKLMARVIARLVDLLDSAEALAQGTITGRIQSAPASDSAGLAVVQTARGMLVHYAHVESERVIKYLTVAPTEWNFHSQGGHRADGFERK